MSKYFSFIILFLSLMISAQGQPNPFSHEEDEIQNTDSRLDESSGKDPEVAYGPGPPGEPVPIDDYIPLLVIIAAGLIIYKTYHRKSLSR